MRAVSSFVRRQWFNLGLAALVLLLYAPSINFGLIWDDPSWYAQGEGQTLWQLFTSLDTYQFYRPLAIWLNRQLVAPDGVIAAQTAHLIQVITHLLTALAAAPLLRAFNLDRRHAQLAALIFALYPLSYQAVAWQAPQQPIATLAVCVALLCAARYTRRRQTAYLIASLGAYAYALLSQESALPFVAMFFWLAFFNPPPTRAACPRRNFWPLLHLALALIFLVIWLNVPRVGGVTGRGLDARVLAYGLQGVTFALAAPLSSPLSGLAVNTLIIVFAAGWLALTLGVWAWHGRRAALLSALWITAGLLPVVIGLSWSYTRIGARLVYPAALGVAIAWGGWVAQLFATGGRRRAVGLAVALGVVGVSIGQWASFQQVYQHGTRFLDETIKALSPQPDRSILLINYPDRLWVWPSPYPLGEWGLILAPVVQNVSDYAVAATGRSAQTVSRSAFRVGADDRAAYPYAVFMRGEDTPPATLAEVAAQTDRVWLTDYAPDGELKLRDVGALRPATSAAYRVQFGEAAQLIESRIDGATVELTWRAISPLREGDTIFVHLWRDGAFVAAFDGDSLGGLIPPANWPRNTEVVDVRAIATGDLPSGPYEVRVGLYNRGDGARYPAVEAQGNRLPDDAAPIGVVDIR